jgi:hypothetical protein
MFSSPSPSQELLLFITWNCCIHFQLSFSKDIRSPLVGILRTLGLPSILPVQFLNHSNVSEFSSSAIEPTHEKAFEWQFVDYPNTKIFFVFVFPPMVNLLCDTRFRQLRHHRFRGERPLSGVSSTL